MAGVPPAGALTVPAVQARMSRVTRRSTHTHRCAVPLRQAGAQQQVAPLTRSGRGGAGVTLRCPARAPGATPRASVEAPGQASQPQARARVTLSVVRVPLLTTPPRQAPPAGERAVQFMVDMACQSCVSAVQKSLHGVEGAALRITNVETDLATQSVVIQGTASTERLLAALSASGRKTRLIGQGSSAGFDDTLARSLGMDLRTLRQSLAAVSEFKGEAWGHGSVVGVVRFVQVNGVATRVEASLDGLAPGRHALAVHTYGDLTSGAASTGAVLEAGGDPFAGFIGTLEADASGRAEMLNGALSPLIQVWDIIGRALVVYEHAEHSSAGANVAAVVARSAVAGDNTKKICACDGTLIWEAGDLIPRPGARAPRK